MTVRVQEADFDLGAELSARWPAFWGWCVT